MMKDLFTEDDIELLDKFQDVISVDTLTNPEYNMILNIKKLEFTEQVKDAILSILSELTKLYYPDKNVPHRFERFSVKRTQVIFGTFGTGKSHILMFLGFLLGYGREIQYFKDNYPDLKRECWNKLEEKVGKEIIAYFNHFKDYDNFFVIISNLIMGNREILMQKASDALTKYYENNPSIQVDITWNPEEKKYEDDFDIFFKDIKSYITKNKKEGVIFLFDEFWKYYASCKDRINNLNGDFIQNLNDGYADSKMSMVLVTQKPFKEISINLQQREERTLPIQITFTGIGKVISNRFFTFKEEKIKKIFEDNYKNSLNPSRKQMVESEFIDCFPFHPKVIWSIERFMQKYSNESRGFAIFIYQHCHKKCNMFLNDSRKMDELITPDKLYDHLFDTKKTDEELNDRFNYYDMVYNDLIKTKPVEVQDIYSKLLKVILVFSNEKNQWKLSDLISVFVNDNYDKVFDIWEELFKYIDKKAEMKFISQTLDNKGETYVYYNPGKKGDSTNFTDKLSDILNNKKLLNQLIISYTKTENTYSISSYNKSNGIDFRYTNGIIGKIKLQLLSGYSNQILLDFFTENLQYILEKMKNPHIYNYQTENYIEGMIVFCLENEYLDNPKNVSGLIERIISDIEDDKFPNEYCLANKLSILKNSIQLIRPKIPNKEQYEQLKTNFSHLVIRNLLRLRKNSNIDNIITKLDEELKTNLRLCIDESHQHIFNNILEEIFEISKENIDGYQNTLKDQDTVNNSILDEIKRSILNGKFLGCGEWENWIDIEEDSKYRAIIERFMKWLFPIKYPEYYYDTSMTKKCYFDDIFSPQTYRKFFTTFFVNLGCRNYKKGKTIIFDESTRNFCNNTLLKMGILESEVILYRDKTRENTTFNFELENVSYLKHFFDYLNENSACSAEEIIKEYCLPPHKSPPYFTLLLIFILKNLDKIQINYKDLPSDWAEKEIKSKVSPKELDLRTEIYKNLKNIIITSPHLVENTKIDNILGFLKIVFTKHEFNGRTVIYNLDLYTEYHEEFINFNNTQINQEHLMRFLFNLSLESKFKKIQNKIKENLELFGNLIDHSESLNIENLLNSIISFRNYDFSQTFSTLINDLKEPSDEDYIDKLSKFYDNFTEKIVDFNDSVKGWNTFLVDFEQYWINILKLYGNFVLEEE